MLNLLSQDIFDEQTGAILSYFKSISETTGIHTHDFFEVFTITSGEVMHMVNNAGQHLFKGSLVFVRPWDAHFYEKKDTRDCTFFNFAFNSAYVFHVLDFLGKEYSSEHLMDAKTPPHITLSDIEMDFILKWLARLNPLMGSNAREFKVQIRAFLAFLFSNILIQDRMGKYSQTPEWLRQLTEELHKKENFTKGMSSITYLCSHSQEHISRCFKKYLGKTPTCYINGIRLDYAANQLKYTDESIIDISLDSGFESLSHFYRVFTERFDVSPARFRKENRKRII